MKAGTRGGVAGFLFLRKVSLLFIDTLGKS